MVKLHIKVSPNAKTTDFGEVLCIDNQKYIKLGLKSPPIDGKANEELIKFLSKYLNIKKDNITITSGLTNKYKTVTISTENLEIINNIKALTKDDN